ncbi:MAG: hypothetical protein JJV95_04410 [Sulfurospirillum sp.]|nr:hypothetical protein [Sulfurospirillum sp.]
MYKIKTNSFMIVAETKEEAFTNLLKLSGYDISSFSEYMEVTVEELEKAPQWAINSLKDLISLTLEYTGYIMKDSRTEGLFKPYLDIENLVKEKLSTQEIVGTQPVQISSDIISKDGAIRTHHLINAEMILKNFIS